jgi:hypothetical protein
MRSMECGGILWSAAAMLGIDARSGAGARRRFGSQVRTRYASGVRGNGSRAHPVASRTSGALATGYIDSLGFASLTRLRRCRTPAMRSMECGGILWSAAAMLGIDARSGAGARRRFGSQVRTRHASGVRGNGTRAHPVAARTSGALATGYIDSLGFASLTPLRGKRHMGTVPNQADSSMGTVPNPRG